MVQTIFLFLNILFLVFSIYSTIKKYRELNKQQVYEHSFIAEIIFISIGLSYILWYCN